MVYGAFSLTELLRTLPFSFVSLWFPFFVGFFLMWYFALPRERRWVVLLVASVLFALVGGWQTLAYALLVSLVAHGAGLLVGAVDRKDRKRRRRLLLIPSLLLVACLAYIKLCVLYGWVAGIVVPVGISYYTFSAISYLADIYRGKQDPERSRCRVALFVLWFPKLLEGPIERHGELSETLFAGNLFAWDDLCHGAQLALWGYFKKMVVADRLAMLTAAGFGGYAEHGGAVMALCAVLSAFQLYCDFSGCMDIARGVSQMFGVRLAENFRQPFLSRSAPEFWRRWHITLGTWFKDYVYLPISVSPRLMAASKRVRDRHGRAAARRLMQAVPLMVVWVLTGLWHGTGAGYLVWGLYWGVLITVSALFGPQLTALAKRLHIDVDAPSWEGVRVVRTFLVFCAARLITVPGDLAVTGRILGSMVTDVRPWELVDGTILSLGLNEANLWVAVLGLGVVILVDILHERGVQIRATVGGWNLLVRVALYACAVLAVLVFGMYGPAYDAASFSYMGF